MVSVLHYFLWKGVKKLETKSATLGAEQERQPVERIWKAVLAHTIKEWVSGPLRRQREAEQYLFNDNSDFRLVCESAGMNADSLRTRLKKLRKQQVQAVNFYLAA